MNKLSAMDRQRVTDALSECARKTRDIENNSELGESAYNILSKKLGDNPGLFKAACQVYNSCKSIHKLSEADDNSRGNSFSILNVQEMADRLAKDNQNKIRKAASAPATFTRTVTPEGSLNKAASATATTAKSLTRIEMPKFSEREYKSFMRDELEDITAFLTKTASELNRAINKKDAALESFVSNYATETRAIRKDAAARLYANYKDKGLQLLEDFGKARPMSKVASEEYIHKYVGTPSIPNTQLYKTAHEAIKATGDLEKVVDDYITKVKSAATSVINIAKAYTANLRKKAAKFETEMDASSLASILGLNDVDNKEKLKDEIYNTEFTNNLLAHSYQRAFMQSVRNEAISKYALHKITEAFNRAVAKMPPNTRLVPATANQQLIESLMIDELAKGNIPSKADTEVISNLASTLGKLDTDKGVYKGNQADA